VHGRRASANRARSERRLGSDSALNNRGESNEANPLQHSCDLGGVFCLFICAIMQIMPHLKMDVKSTVPGLYDQ